MSIRLDEARLRMLKIVDTSNTTKIYPNNITSYGGLVIEGYKKGGYNGIHLGPNTNYMTIMSDSEHQGLYNSGNEQWIIYYNRIAAGVGFGTTTLAGNNKVTIEGNATIKNLLTVANGASHYGIKVGNTYINAIDGDVIFQNNNALRFGSDNWNYDEWAGLKYDWTNKRIYLGIADQNIFAGNSVLSGGRILTPGISHFHVGNQTTYYMASDGGIKASGITVDNNNSSGSIQLVEDGEGGTIRLYSKSNTYCYEIDAYNDETIRIHTASKNPNGAAKFIYWNGKNGNVSTDGTFYVQNTYPVMPMKSANGYYGMTLPDVSDTNWIRTTNYGIIPYTSGGASALGTESWPFNNIWSKTVNIIDTYYPAFRLTAQTANSFSTYSKGMFEVNYTDSIGMWIHSDKTTDAKSRRALVVYGWGAKSDDSQAVALRQCNTSGTWLSDLYLLHSGNYSNYAMPVSYWSWSGQSGQPTWVWGGNEYGQYKVWNPANFNVNSAKSINSSGTITMISGTAKHPSGFTVGDIYSSGYPFSYGSTWRYQGTFGAELIFNGLGGDAGVGTGHMYFRTRSDWATSTWGDWKHLLDSSNYTTYTVTKTGTGASGTWSISVTGSAATLYDSSAGALTWSGDHMLSSSTRPNAKLHFGTDTLYQYRSSTYYIILDSGNYTSYAAPASHTHNYLPLSGGTLTGRLAISYAHTGGGMLQLMSTNSNEASIDYAAGGTTYWVVGKGCGGTGNGTFAWWYNPNGANAMTLTSAGVLNTAIIGASTRIYTGYDSGQTGSISCSNWFRSSGATGWYNATYDGGWYMSDTTWIRTHNSKGVYTGSGQIRSDRVDGGMWISGTHQATFVAGTATTAAPGNYYQGWYSGKTQSGAWSMGALAGSENLYFVYGTDGNYNTGTNTVANVQFGSGGQVYGAVWNDYAEYRSQTEDLKPGYVAYCDNDGNLKQTISRLQKFEGVVSDTFGFAIGETEDAKTPLAVSGRVLVYTYEDRNTFNSGDCVCAGPNGRVCKMTREEIVRYPDRIVGIVSEIPEYDTWGTGKVNVDGRIWIKVK